MSMPFPVTCGSLTVGQLVELLRRHDDAAEVFFTADRLPSGVGRLCVQEATAANASLRIAPAEIIGYCRQADSPAPRDSNWADRGPQPTSHPAEPSRPYCSLGPAAARVA